MLVLNRMDARVSGKLYCMLTAGVSGMMASRDRVKVMALRCRLINVVSQNCSDAIRSMTMLVSVPRRS